MPAKKLSLHELALHSAAQTTDCPYPNSLTIKPEQSVKRKQPKVNDFDEENSAQFFYDGEYCFKSILICLKHFRENNILFS